MAESTLSINYDDLVIDVAHFLGWPTAVASQSEDQVARIDRIIQEGYRQYLYPPAIEGVEAGYEWTWLKPVTTISTTADQGEDDLPDDFGRLIDGFTYPANEQVPSVLADVGEGHIRSLLVQDTTTGRPRKAGIRWKAGTGATGQRKQVLWYPIPDDAYTLSYRYEAFVGELDSSGKEYPLGGMKHASLLRQSCLVAAEQIEMDKTGTAFEVFVRMLRADIQRDKKSQRKLFGNVGTGNQFEDMPCMRVRDCTITINDVEV